jgi:HK97 family phage major capsid protein
MTEYEVKIAKLNDDITKCVGEVKAIMDKYEGKATPEAEADKLDALAKQGEDMQTEVKRLERLNGLDVFSRELDMRIPHATKGGKTNPATGEETEVKTDPIVGYITTGRAFTLSKEYVEGKDRRFAGSSHMAKMEVVKGGLVPIRKSLYDELMAKADDVTSSIAGDLILPQRVSEIVREEDRPLRVRNLLTVGQTGSDTIEYLEETYANNASGVPEVFGLPGGLTSKPKSDIRYEKKTGNVKTIAHYVRISNKMLEDAAQLELMINSRLAYGLDKVEEDQLLWGADAGDDLAGILNTTGVQDYAGAIAGRGVVDDTLLDKIRRSRTNVEMEFLEASGVCLHPLDYETIELLKGTDARYLWVTVNDGGIPRVWRLPVVETVAMADPEGTGNRFALVGAFKMGAAIFDRSGTNVEVGYANDDFITNYKRVRAEKRLALIVWRPAAFVRIETEVAGS